MSGGMAMKQERRFEDKYFEGDIANPETEERRFEDKYFGDREPSTVSEVYTDNYMEEKQDPDADAEKREKIEHIAIVAGCFVVAIVMYLILR